MWDVNQYSNWYGHLAADLGQLIGSGSNLNNMTKFSTVCFDAGMVQCCQFYPLERKCLHAKSLVDLIVDILHHKLCGKNPRPNNYHKRTY